MWEGAGIDSDRTRSGGSVDDGKEGNGGNKDRWGILSEQGFDEKISEPGASHMYSHDRSGSMPVQKGTGVGCRFFLHKRSVVQLYSYPSTFRIGTILGSVIENHDDGQREKDR